MRWLIPAVSLLAASLTGPALAQSALKGRVTVDSSLVPVPGAEILVRPGEHTARADREGAFVLGRLPGGIVHVTVRAVGFRALEAELDLPAGDTLDLVFELSREPTTLAPLVVTERATPASGKLVEFERRRALGFGSFFSRGELAAYDAYPLSDALRTLSSVKLLPRQVRCGGGYAAATTRGGARSSPCVYGEGCFVGIYVDGARIYDPSDPEPPDINQYLTAHIEAIELYRGAGELPAELQGTGTACGALVIWTRVGGPR